MSEDAATATAAAMVTYEELAGIEDEFDEIDMEIMRKQYHLSTPLYAKRAAAIAKIPNFWPLVLEQAPPEIDQFIQPSDSRIFASSLLGIAVSRPELDAGTAGGSPRSLKIRFEFAPNEDFEDTVLEKEFFYRRSTDGWAGLVSEPVKISWKSGKDLTEGLGEGAVKLFEARKKAGDLLSTEVPEYEALRKKVEHLNGAGTSFFTWFGWVSGRRYVSAEESALAEKAREAKRAERKAGAAVEMPTEGATGDADDSEVEVHEMGEELAVSFAEDLWPNAIKFFTEAQEVDDEELSEMDFEEDDDDEDEEAEAVDIRALVNGGKKRQSDAGPPSKKRKQ